MSETGPARAVSPTGSAPTARGMLRCISCGVKPAMCTGYAFRRRCGTRCATPPASSRRCNASRGTFPNWSGNASWQGRAAILRRLFAYSERVFRLSAELIAGMTGRRLEPRIFTAKVAKSAAVMFWARMVSLNASEVSSQSRFWRHWPGGALPSADIVGNVYSKLDASRLRDAMHQVYGQLKRDRALPDNGGIPLAIVDGHQSHTSYLQHCQGCCRGRAVSQREIDSVLSPAGDAAAGAWCAGQAFAVAGD